MPGRHAREVTSDELANWKPTWQESDPDRWMEPLRQGGSRTEKALNATFRDRGLLLANRVGRQAMQLRRALDLREQTRRAGGHLRRALRRRR